jgi:hypothetical protein
MILDKFRRNRHQQIFTRGPLFGNIHLLDKHPTPILSPNGAPSDPSEKAGLTIMK